jgi:hypothetical protein
LELVQIVIDGNKKAFAELLTVEACYEAFNLSNQLQRS